MRKESEVIIMKRYLMALCIILTMLLCACQSSKNTDSLDYKSTFAKAQAISVISSDTLQVIETITDEEDINDFTLALDVDKWKLTSLPEDTYVLGYFGLSKQKTITLFDVNPDETLYDVATITLYEGGYIGVEVDNLNWLVVIFEVSTETNNFLKAYFE